MSKLFTRLTLSYVMISVLMVAIAVVFSNFMIGGIFKKYESDVQARKTDAVTAALVSEFEPVLMGWKPETLENIGKNALQQGLIIKVKDPKGNLVWSAYDYHDGADADLIKNMAKTKDDGVSKLIENEFKIRAGDVVLGELYIGYYGTYYYTRDDEELVSRLNLMFLYVSTLAFVVAACVGLYMSREIAFPVIKVTDMTGQIAKNDFKEEIKYNSDIYEISDLISSINYLSKTLENNRNLRKRMTVDIAHELRTPLTVVQSHLEAIIDGIWQPTPERLQSCYDEVSRLGKLVESLKKIDDLDNGIFRLDIKDFSLNDLLNSIYLNFSAEFKKKKINFLLKQKENITLFSDKDHLRQVIINLLSNALKYTCENGEVTIACEKKDGAVSISVSDNGVGISDEDLPFIFERLYRADVSRSKNTGGFGVGLTIAKYEIEALGGSISVSSVHGKGSVFTVTVPEKIG